MFSIIQRFEAVGDFFHPDEQVETTSTTEVPFPAMEFSKASRSIFFVLRAAAGVCTLWRVTRHVPSSCASRFPIFSG